MHHPHVAGHVVTPGSTVGAVWAVVGLFHSMGGGHVASQHVLAVGTLEPLPAQRTHDGSVPLQHTMLSAPPLHHPYLTPLLYFSTKSHTVLPSTIFHFISKLHKTYTTVLQNILLNLKFPGTFITKNAVPNPYYPFYLYHTLDPHILLLISLPIPVSFQLITASPNLRYKP